jgi:hypothetical protein
MDYGYGVSEQYQGPARMLYLYKHIRCSVPGGTATVSINKYKNNNHKHKRDEKTNKIVQKLASSCEDGVTLKNALIQAAPEAIQRAGGAVSFVNVFVGKGSPTAIASVLESFAIYSDRFIQKFSAPKTDPILKTVADLLAADAVSWEEALQKICDLHIGLDCNGFVGNWLKKFFPEFKLNQDSKANDVRNLKVTYRSDQSEIGYWDIMAYAANEHIAAIEFTNESTVVDKFAVCQSAGGGPRINPYSFRKSGRDGSGRQLFQLDPGTAQDVGYNFYVVSLW